VAILASRRCLTFGCRGFARRRSAGFEHRAADPRMQRDPLSPGDRVIELAALALSAAVAAGGMAAAAGAWLAHRSWAVTLGALVCGGLGGLVVGLFIGRVLYRTDDGQTAIVRAGRKVLPAALAAGLAGGMASALASAILSAWLLATPPLPTLIAAACCGVLAALVLSSLASLA
jgi:hypothetical protein